MLDEKVRLGIQAKLMALIAWGREVVGCYAKV